MAKDFFLRTLRGHASLSQHDEFFADAVRLFEIVAHEQRRSAVARQRFAKLALERAAQMRVQRGKWLVEQAARPARWPARARARRVAARRPKALQGSAPQGHRDARRQAVRRRGDSSLIREMPQPERDIFRHGQMRKQRVVLEKQTDAARARGHIDALARNQRARAREARCARGPASPGPRSRAASSSCPSPKGRASRAARRPP